VSFVVNCETQEEVDYYWTQLSEGGQPSRCGWLKDRFGLSWQVVPTALSRLLSSGSAEQSGRVMQALMQMDKIVIMELENAADNHTPAMA
jgi:predicted 3-demethylubiquinone-9 3-methyltransferase (glyoxalase superfamily)